MKLLEHIERMRLLYRVARWFAGRESHESIAKELKEWLDQEHPGLCKGIPTKSFVGHRIAEAAREGFLEIARSSEKVRATGDDLVEDLQRWLGGYGDKLNIIVAPDSEELLRYVWIDLEAHLVNKLMDEKRERNGQPVILGVSGGRTMLRLARVQSEPVWAYQQIPDRQKRVIVCSLTSGGTRDNIAALSDTVAALVAERLGATARGLLGPAWFVDKVALAAFRADKEVIDHIALANKADVILTSVGDLRAPGSLLGQVLSRTAREWLAVTLNREVDLADLLYNCYDGLRGDPVSLPPEVADHLFSVMDLKRLRGLIKGGSRCIVVVDNPDKCAHTLVGLIKQRMADYIYMDRACAVRLRVALSLARDRGIL